MSLPQDYINELNALNKEIQRQQPTDILQFCSNYFLGRLEEQRKYQQLIEPKVQKALGLSLFPTANNKGAQDATLQQQQQQQTSQQAQQQQQSLQQAQSQQASQSPLLFKQPFTNDDPHAKHTDELDPHFKEEDRSVQPGIFKTGFEVGEENKSVINSTIDPVSSNPTTQQTSSQQPSFAIANALAAAQARRSSSSAQIPSFQNHSIPSTFNANRRTSVSAETLNPNGIKDDFKYPVIPKTPDQLNRLSNSVAKNFLFSSLDADALNTLINALKEVKLPSSSEIIKQGDEGDFFYVVEDGLVDFYLDGKHINSSGAGSSFGELALMYNSPRALTVVASTDVILWALDRLTFRRILLAKTSKKRQLYESFLKDVPVLNLLSNFERSKLADALETEHHKKDATIIKEGEVGENFYLIIKGEAEVVKQNEGVVKKLKRGDYFGEVALLNDLPRQASVVATSNVDVATLDKRGFQRLLGPAVDVLKRQDPTKH